MTHAKHRTVREYALTMDRIDTHAHLEVEYPDLDVVVQRCRKPFADSGAIGISRSLSAGCRVLYGIDPGAYLVPDSDPAIFKAARKLRAKGRLEALEFTLDKAGISKQLVFSGQLGFQNHRPASCRLTQFSKRLSVLAYLDPLVTGNDWAFTPDGGDDSFCWYRNTCGLLGKMKNLADYTTALDHEIDGWRGHGVVGMKIGMAYTTGLSFGNHSISDVRKAFARREQMSREEIRMVQDFAVRHAIEACRRNCLPVVIHTGFLAWGHGDLMQANPMLLHNLISDPRFKDVSFVLLHGGFPAHTGETTYLAGMFRNVVIDFTWMPWMTPGRFRQALTEWLEVVPTDRFCWGSDSGTLESIAGIGVLVREAISEVLEDAINRRIIDESTAIAFVEKSYLETPGKLFFRK